MINKEKAIKLVEKLILNEKSILIDKFFLKEGKLIIQYKRHSVILEDNNLIYVPANCRNIKEKISVKNREFKKLKKLFLKEKKRRDSENKIKQFKKLQGLVNKDL